MILFTDLAQTLRWDGVAGLARYFGVPVDEIVAAHTLDPKCIAVTVCRVRDTEENGLKPSPFYYLAMVRYKDRRRDAVSEWIHGHRVKLFIDRCFGLGFATTPHVLDLYSLRRCQRFQKLLRRDDARRFSLGIAERVGHR